MIPPPSVADLPDSTRDAALEGAAREVDAPRPLVDHLADLRACLVRGAAGWGAATLASFAAYPRLLELLVRPPVERLVFTSPVEPFFAQIRLAMIGGIVLSFPWLLYQAWRFVAPGLKPAERSALLRLIPGAYLLFLAGSALGLFVAAPMGLKFLLSYSSPILVPYITLQAYLGYLGYLTLGMGALFQLPVVLYALSMTGLVGPEGLSRYRRHAILAILIAAAAITPGPDVFSQLLIALPTYLLFELSIAAARLASR